MKIVVSRRALIGVCCVSGSVLIPLAGCGGAPDAPTVQDRQQSAASQIQSIQDNPNMPPDAKQRAIDGMKAQQSHVAIQPAPDGAASPQLATQIQSIQNNPNMPPEAKARAIEGMKFQQKRTAP